MIFLHPFQLSRCALIFISLFLLAQSSLGFGQSLKKRGFEVRPVFQTHLLTIGIDYNGSVYRLKNASSDANKFRNILLRKYGINPETEIILRNEEATQDNIIDSLLKLGEKASPRDSIIIFFAGHSYPNAEKTRFYWAPYVQKANALDKDHQFIEAGIDVLTVYRIIERMDVLHKLLIVDSCWSGSLVTSLNEGREVKDLTLASKFSSFQIMTSSGFQLALDGYGTSSPYAEPLIDFLESFNGNKLTPFDLHQFILSSFDEIHTQEPMFREKGLGSFIFHNKDSPLGLDGFAHLSDGIAMQNRELELIISQGLTEEQNVSHEVFETDSEWVIDSKIGWDKWSKK